MNSCIRYLVFNPDQKRIFDYMLKTLKMFQNNRMLKNKIMRYKFESSFYI